MTMQPDLIALCSAFFAAFTGVGPTTKPCSQFGSAIFGGCGRRGSLACAAKSLPSASHLYSLLTLRSPRRGRPPHGGLRFLLTVAIIFRAHLQTVADASGAAVVQAVP